MNTTTTTNPVQPTALILYLTEDDTLLCAITPKDSELAKKAKLWHEIPYNTENVGEEGCEAFDYIVAWFLDSQNKHEVCPCGELQGTNLGSVVSIYRVGC